MRLMTAPSRLAKYQPNFSEVMGNQLQKLPEEAGKGGNPGNTCWRVRQLLSIGTQYGKNDVKKS